MQTTALSAWNVTEPGILDMDRYLSSVNAPDFEEDASLCIRSGERNMVLNCAPLSYMTGAGARALLAVAKLMKEVGGTLTLQGLSGQPRQLFDACGLDLFVALDDEASVLPAVRAA